MQAEDLETVVDPANALKVDVGKAKVDLISDWSIELLPSSHDWIQPADWTIEIWNDFMNMLEFSKSGLCIDFY